MKSKIVSGALALMIAAGSLVGCNAMKQGVEEVMPSASAPAATATGKPATDGNNGPDMSASASPTAPAATASPAAGTGVMN